MGSTLSAEIDPDLLPGTRDYNLPYVREKSRYVTGSNQQSAQFDPTVDKYDYLICFPITQGSFTSPVISAKEPMTESESVGNQQQQQQRIKWEEILRVWKKVVPGTDEKKEKAIQELAKVWKARTGSVPKLKDKIRWTAWQTIAREAIVEQLTKLCGLQLKLTANRNGIYCRIRAPIRLLEMQADKEDYKLQLKGEIDPGSEHFWNREVNNVAVELMEEARLLSIDEAKDILEKLYTAGKITASDLSYQREEESEEMLSRRVHALERIADRVPVSNRYVAYATLLTTKPHLRYLFQTYPSVRGNSLFRSKDRLLLTRSIISQHFDVEVLISEHLVDLFIPLHDANRGERLTTTSLSSRWVCFWRGQAKEVGAPNVTHLAYDEDFDLSWYLRPFAQPLSDIREYFGEKVALYFAWNGFFTYYLSVPALLGLAINAYFSFRGYQFEVDDSAQYDYVDYVYIFCIVSWAVIYDQSWRRECKAIAIKWGTRGFENEEKTRPEFEGDSDPRFAEQRTYVNNLKETYYPPYKRNLKVIGFGIVIVLILLLDLLLQFGFFYAQYLLGAEYQTTTFLWVFSLLLALLINIASVYFLNIAKTFNDRENYRTDTDYEDHLVSKVLFFEMFNSFAACFFVAFGKEYVFDDCYINCVYDLRILLYSIMFFRILKALVNFAKTMFTAIGWTRRVVWNTFLSIVTCGMWNRNMALNDREEMPLLGSTTIDASSSAEDSHFLAELSREKYAVDDAFFASAELFMQFAYINLFSVIVPALAIASFFENLVKIRLDAYRLCNLSQRPPVERAEDSGLWADNMHFVIIVGIYCNVAIMTLAFPDLTSWSVSTKVIVFLAVSQVLLLYMLAVKMLLPEDADELEEICARQDFVVDKYVKGFLDSGPDDEENGFAGDSSGLLEDNIDVDALQLYDLRKGQTIRDEVHEEISRLERQRRDLMRELTIKKDQLQDIYKSEVYNENTGIGETKHGLPLGRLQFKLMRLEDFNLSAEIGRYPERFSAKFRIELRNRRIGGASPLPDLPVTVTDSRVLEVNLSESVINIDQSIGPLAPVKLIDADVHIVMILIPNATTTPNITSEMPMATVSFPLRDLQDQSFVDKRLKLKVRDIVGEFQSPARPPVLSVNCLFQYSKVVPVRKDIYFVQEKLHETEKELTRLKSGK